MKHTKRLTISALFAAFSTALLAIASLTEVADLAISMLGSAILVIAAIEHIVIDGNTYIYLIDTEENLYRAKVANHEEMLLLKEGDSVKLTCIGKEIQSYEKAE